jgi:hypothetical protein
MMSLLPKKESCMDKKDKPIVSMSKEEREEVWDDVYAKEEGIIVEFNPESNTGKVRSVNDDNIYEVDSRELVKTKIDLHLGDKVLFAPGPDNDQQRVRNLIDLENTKISMSPLLLRGGD